MSAQATKKRVLVVDDAVVVRKTLSDAVARDSSLEVAATAANGRIALEKFSAVKPDIVLLDIEMPEMDGLETVRELRKIDLKVPILLFSTLTERGASATLEALSLGATDYVTKPSNLDMGATLLTVAHELIPKIRALCHLSGSGTEGKKPSVPVVVPPSVPSRLLVPAQVIVIGVSTGGPDALARLLPSLPADLPVPVLVAQHMPAIFTQMLAMRLAGRSAIAVREATPGEELCAGTVFIAPGDFHMLVTADRGKNFIATNRAPKENFCRPSVDVLFRSVACVYGARALAVVLTGMGQDGLNSCHQLRQLGARVIVQDEATSVVWGMPGNVARAGLADKILPLERIGPEMVAATSMQRTRAVTL